MYRVKNNQKYKGVGLQILGIGTATGTASILPLTSTSSLGTTNRGASSVALGLAGGSSIATTTSIYQSVRGTSDGSTYISLLRGQMGTR